MAVKIQFRRDTASNWSNTTVLASGEIGYETDTGNLKIGDGLTQWSNLAYYHLPNVSVNPATTVDLNNAAYRVMGRYRLNSITGTTFTNTPSDFQATVDADSVSTLIVTSHAYSGLQTHIQQTLTQFSASATELKQWVRLYNGTNWTAWTSTAHLTANEVVTSNIADATSTTTGVTNSKLRHSSAASVIGRSADTVGAPADIVSAADGEVLRRSGTVIGFGQIGSAGISSSAVTNAKIADAAVTTAKLGASAVASANIAADAVDPSQFNTSLPTAGMSYPIATNHNALRPGCFVMCSLYQGAMTYAKPGTGVTPITNSAGNPSYLRCVAGQTWFVMGFCLNNGNTTTMTVNTTVVTSITDSSTTIDVSNARDISVQGRWMFFAVRTS